MSRSWFLSPAQLKATPKQTANDSFEMSAFEAQIAANTRAYKAQLLRQPHVFKTDLADWAGVPRATARAWFDENRLFALPGPKGTVVPLFQLPNKLPHPAVAEVLAHLSGETPWAIAAFFDEPDNWACRGMSPMALLTQDPKAVVEAARHSVAEVFC